MFVGDHPAVAIGIQGAFDPGLLTAKDDLAIVGVDQGAFFDAAEFCGTLAVAPSPMR